MYSKNELRQLKQEFWETFNRYTQYYSRELGEPIEWMMYKTKIKGLELKFEVENHWVKVILEINSKNEDRRLHYFAELEKYRSLIDEGFEEGLLWDDSVKLKEGKTVSQIYTINNSYYFHNKDHWKDLFHFMATNMYRLQTNLKELLPVLEETLK